MELGPRVFFPPERLSTLFGGGPLFLVGSVGSCDQGRFSKVLLPKGPSCFTSRFARGGLPEQRFEPLSGNRFQQKERALCGP
jgi:hypothetical protein